MTNDAKQAAIDDYQRALRKLCAELEEARAPKPDGVVGAFRVRGLPVVDLSAHRQAKRGSTI